MFEFENSQDDAENEEKKSSRTKPQKKPSPKKATSRLPSKPNSASLAPSSTKKRKTIAPDCDSDVEAVSKPMTSITTAPEAKEPLLHRTNEEEPLFTEKQPSVVLITSVTSTYISSTTAPSSSPSSSSNRHAERADSSHRRSDISVVHRTPREVSSSMRESSRELARDIREHRRDSSREPAREQGRERAERPDARFSKPSRLGKARPATVAPTPRTAVRDMLDELVKRYALFGDVGSSSMEPERRGRKRGEDSKDEEFPPDLFSPKICRGMEDVLRILDGKLLLLARLVSHHIFLYPSILDNFNSLTLTQKLRLISKDTSRHRPIEHGDSELEANEEGNKDTLRIRAIMDELCEQYLLVGGPYSTSELDALFEDCETVKDALRLNPWTDLLPNIRLHALLNPHISRPFRNMSMQEKMAYF